VTIQTLPAFLTFAPNSFIPKLKPRQVPLMQWALQVLVLTTGSLLNNWAYAYNVPLTVLIVFRSAGEQSSPNEVTVCPLIPLPGLPISMLFGMVFLQRKYNPLQIVSHPFTPPRGYYLMNDSPLVFRLNCHCRSLPVGSL
jgi:UDP-xylose/UDP-N-acetylglucosamine transporter B4